MSEPRAVADAVTEVVPGVWHWHLADERIGGFIGAAHAVRSANGVVLIDPLPLVDITVVVPAGFEAAKAEEAGAAILMGDILDAGTEKLDRPSYLDRLATFGASHDFAEVTCRAGASARPNLATAQRQADPAVRGRHRHRCCRAPAG